jgi:FixJ family two-component response regulator
MPDRTPSIRLWSYKARLVLHKIFNGRHPTADSGLEWDVAQPVPTDSTPVYVIDDDPSVRTAMGRLLRSASYTVYEFPSAEAFLGQCSIDRPGCLLLDLKMPSVSGLDLVEVLEQGDSSFTAVLMTGVGDIQDSVKAMKLGAVDFLTKPLEESQILASIKSAMRLSWQRYWQRNERTRLQQLFDKLTPRERQVCELVSLGLPNKQTALRLGASEKTVKIHRGRVMSKLAVNSVAELVRFVDRLQPDARRT